MKSGVAPTMIGVLTLRDVRGALRDRFDTATSVDVVIPNTMGFPFAGSVTFAWKRHGPAFLRMLACPKCEKPKFALHVNARGDLACKVCNRVRFRREIARSTHTWNFLGDREEDRLLRLLARPHLTHAGLERSRHLGQDLARADEDRAAAVIANTQYKLAMAGLQ